MKLFYELGTSADLISDNFKNSLSYKKVLKNLSLLSEYIRDNQFQMIRSFNKESEIIGPVILEGLETLKPINPLFINSDQLNEIELKNILIDHKGDIFIEKNEFILNDNLNTVLTFFSTDEILLYGIVSPEELLKSAIVLNSLGFKVSVIEDAALSFNQQDIAIKNLLEQINERDIKLIKTINALGV